VKNLKILRKAKGLSQAQVAQFLHLGSSTVCRWELGQTKPTLCQFLKLCQILSCIPAQLCDGFDTREIPVFDTENANIAAHSVTRELAAAGCCFGLVLPFDILPRFKKGDICYFSMEDNPDANNLVLAYDDNYTEYLYLFKGHKQQLHIIASCKLMHIKIQ